MNGLISNFNQQPNIAAILLVLDVMQLVTSLVTHYFWPTISAAKGFSNKVSCLTIGRPRLTWIKWEETRDDSDKYIVSTASLPRNPSKSHDAQVLLINLGPPDGSCHLACAAAAASAAWDMLRGHWFIGWLAGGMLGAIFHGQRQQPWGNWWLMTHIGRK